MTMASSQTDLERKTETAVATRLKQHPLLAKVRTRLNSEDSPKVNQDLIVAAKRGEGNPPYSGIFNLEVTVTFSMRHRKSVDTLPSFLRLCAAMEEVFNVTTVDYPNGVPVQRIAREITACVPNFHCYELMVVGKDDSPDDQGQKHKCVWVLTIIAMSGSYATGLATQSQT